MVRPGGDFGGVAVRQVSSLAEALAVRRGDMLALVGGGGKTSLMYALAEAALRAGQRAGATTTTRIGRPPRDGAGILVSGNSVESLCAAAAVLPPNCYPIFTRELQGEKVSGVPSDWCRALLEEGGLDLLVVEADGAKRLPLKVPAAWEPVIPEDADAAIAVVGLSAVGAPLGPDTVFRWELARGVLEAAGCSGVVGAEALTALLTSPLGLHKGFRPGMRSIAFLNQLDTVADRRVAERVAASLLGGTSPVYHRVVAGAVRFQEQGFLVWQRGRGGSATGTGGWHGSETDGTTRGT